MLPYSFYKERRRGIATLSFLMDQFNGKRQLIFAARFPFLLSRSSCRGCREILYLGYPLCRGNRMQEKSSDQPTEICRPSIGWLFRPHPV
jgi:hypothetical protein